MVLILAQEAVNHPEYKSLSQKEKQFILLPFMHSESLALHDWTKHYFLDLGNEEVLRFEKLHQEVLEKFGRYPNRNSALGRESTSEKLRALEISKNGFYS